MIVPDLPGHGRHAPLSHNDSFENLAASVAQIIPPASRVVVLGHSPGGAITLTLASGGFGTRMDTACGLGIKFQWSADEPARVKAQSTKPNPVCASRQEAAERHLKLAGLTGLLAPDDVAEGALIQDDRGWRVAFDPLAFAVGAPDLPGLLATAKAKIVLATGEHDPMCPADALRALSPDAIVLPGVGHNAHVERPDALWPLLERLGSIARRATCAVTSLGWTQIAVSPAPVFTADLGDEARPGFFRELQPSTLVLAARNLASNSSPSFFQRTNRSPPRSDAQVHAVGRDAL